MQGTRIVIGVVAVLLVVGLGVWGYSAWSYGQDVDLLEINDPTPEQIDRMIALLDTDDAGVQLRVDQRVSELGEKAVPGLMKLVQTTAARIGARKDAAEMLGYINEDKFYEALRVLLDPATMPEAEGRILATGILTSRRRQDPRGEELVRLCAKDPDPGPRGFAAENLGPSSMALLQQLAQDPVEYIAGHAQRHIGELQRQMRR